MNDRDYSSTSVNISSDTLFHFTDRFENVLNILQNYFSPRYCLEYGVNDDELIKKEGKPPSIARPLISFCDLPLSLIRSHLQFYGNYGIGLTKKWGMRNGISPVMYIHTYSISLRAVQNFAPAVEGGKLPQKLAEYGTEFLVLAGYLKPYEGPAWRHGIYYPNKRFYNEREWRYYPNINFWERHALLRYNQYVDKDELEKLHVLLGHQFKLEFESEDIMYIILKDDEEVIAMEKELQNFRKKGRFNEEEVILLTSRMMTSDMITTDT